ncbi:lytic transglycosylase domain-containing protein [Noviherbaspirillum galbum]|uniref:Lytic transglycosylase domain-containing protein n=1 Tax=Noviherbaspirillum galbum TaxID=2709383 RepID=A0A6B3SYV5_9BURK|nr:lytic transglycosylase domain-containing protein [Noviherbaspirillum galbum]NEX63359.1 lytic transglycosylase domain-containing protein [Noviherbaspirillum galbum]
MIRRGLALMAGLAACLCANAQDCWTQAGTRYGINPYLLAAIAKTESGLNPRAINRNKNGSYDVGLMQINSAHFPKLAKYGITEQQLYDPCVSIHVGAWILASNFRDLGYNWRAIGAYNAADPVKRYQYVSRVYKHVPKALIPQTPTQP